MAHRLECIKLAHRWNDPELIPDWLTDCFPGKASQMVHSRLGPRWAALDYLQIGSQRGHPRLGPRWADLDDLPNEVPYICSQIEGPKLAKRFGCLRMSPRLDPRWVPKIGSQVGHSRLAHRWGTPDLVTHVAPNIGYQMWHPT